MQTVIDILSKLVSFNTISLQSNLAMIDYIDTYLADYGIAARRVYSEDGLRANLYATIGNPHRGGICFSGHSDVVPVEGQPWSQDPFVLTARDGRLYGRGSADMKGYLACVLALVPEFIEATRHPDAAPVHIAVSYDEEIGCVGVRGLLDELSRDAVRPSGCIVGEPTLMKVATAHKGKSAWRCAVHGQAAHSSQPDLGVNAIEIAAELVTFLRQQGKGWQQETGDARYDPPWSTVQVGTIKGGTAVNVVPDHCEFDFEIRALPGSPHQQLPQTLQQWASQELLPDMRRVSPDTDIHLLQQVEYPGLQDDQSMDALKQQCASALPQHDFESVAFGTEAGLFQQAGIPTVICGPGSITQAHKADEYIELSQLELCLTFLRKMVSGGSL